jgi:hypothetical protein
MFLGLNEQSSMYSEQQEVYIFILSNFLTVSDPKP